MRTARSRTAEKRAVKKRFNGVSWFTKIILIAIFVYGLFRLWNHPWTEGLSIIAGVLVIWLIIKIIEKIRKK